MANSPKNNPCKCIDCGGNEQWHSEDCTYMLSMEQDEPSEEEMFISDMKHLNPEN